VERAEAKIFAKRECYKNLFSHATFPKSLALDIHASGNDKFTLHMLRTVPATKCMGILAIRQF
jgi:hypothetical protein